MGQLFDLKGKLLDYLMMIQWVGSVGSRAIRFSVVSVSQFKVYGQ